MRRGRDRCVWTSTIYLLSLLMMSPPAAKAIPLSAVHLSESFNHHQEEEQRLQSLYDYSVKSDHLAALLQQTITSSRPRLSLYDDLPWLSMLGGGCCIVVGSILMIWGLLVATPVCTSNTRQVLCQGGTLPSTSGSNPTRHTRRGGRTEKQISCRYIMGQRLPTFRHKISLSDGDGMNAWSEASSLSGSDAEHEHDYSFAPISTPQSRRPKWAYHVKQYLAPVSERGTAASQSSGGRRRLEYLSQRGRKRQQRRRTTWQDDESIENSIRHPDDSTDQCLLLYGVWEWRVYDECSFQTPLVPSLSERKLAV